MLYEVITEKIDTGMFKVLPDDGIDVDIFTYPFDSWFQAADSANDQVNFASLTGGLVKAFDDIRINK